MSSSLITSTMKAICKICGVERTQIANQILTNSLIKSGYKMYNSKGELEVCKKIKECECK